MRKGRDKGWNGGNGPGRTTGAGGAQGAQDRSSSDPAVDSRRDARTDREAETAGGDECCLCPLVNFEHSQLFSELSVRSRPELPLRGVRRATVARPESET